MSKLKPYIDALSQAVGIPLEMASEDSFVAQLGEHHFLAQIPDGGDVLLFYMEIGVPPEEDRDEILIRCLAGNQFLTETKGAALSYTPENSMVGLNMVLPTDTLNEERFIDAFDMFMTAAENWTRQVAGPGEASPEAPAAAQNDAPGMVRA